MSGNVFILLGATGALGKKRLLPILDNIDAKVILYTRSPIESKFSVVLGNLDNFEPLLKVLDKRSKLYFYLALPPNLYESTLKSIKNYFDDWGFKIAIEKPFGTSLKNAKELSKIIKSMNPKRFYLVDHYLAKEDFVKRKNLKNLKNIKRIKVAILEKEDVKDRGAFYDKVGAIKDTGQNHLLNMASSLLNPKNKLEALKNLKYKKGTLITKQYSGYKNTEGVAPDSKTETYFKAKLNYRGIEITLENGKRMSKTLSFIEVKYKDGKNYEIKIGSNHGSTDFAHKHVVEDFLLGRNKFSLKVSEAIEAWRIIEQIEKDQN